MQTLAAALAASRAEPPPSATTKPCLFFLISSAQASISVTSGFGETSPKAAVKAPLLPSTIF